VIDMIEIGAGGGSIARVDSLGLITVGPESAGSDPGPVSYGLGGERCTVTDADVVLGYLDPERFLGGRMRLDAEAAERVVQAQVADRIGIPLVEAAWGIHATVNESMANAARVHAIERGQDPAGLPVFVLGGNGPLHGPGVARALGSRTLVVPPAAGVLSAVGFLSAALSIDFVHSWHTELESVDPEAAAAAFAGMEDEGGRVLAGSGVAEETIVHTRSLDMRFVGQGSEIEVSVPPVGPDWRDQVRARFVEQYEERFGSVAPGEVRAEILSWRVTSRGPEPDTALRAALPDEAGDPLLGHRDAYFPEAGGYTSTAVYDRYRLAVGVQVDGPALVQEREATLVLPPGAHCVVEKDGSLVVTLPGDGGPR
jgi:N-methylhydantoinase A